MLTGTELVLLAVLVLAAASFLLLAWWIRAVLLRTQPLQDALALSLARLTARAQSAEEITEEFRTQNRDLVSAVTQLRYQNREVEYLRSEVTTAHNRMLALISRPALAQVSQMQNFVGGVGGSNPPPTPDGFSLYPTEDSPTDTIVHRDPPQAFDETRVIQPPSQESPAGYGEGGSVVLDEKVEELLFSS